MYVQVIKPGMEIPENLRVYASKVLFKKTCIEIALKLILLIMKKVLMSMVSVWLKIYFYKHSELGNRPVGVVEFETPEAAHRCCRELDSGQDGENARICLLGTRIRSFARHRYF